MMGAIIPRILFLIIVSLSCCLCFDASDLEKGKKDCGGNYTHPTGSFTLTLHNLSHPCIWYINATHLNSTGITLLFETLFLHENDEVTLYSEYDDIAANKSLIEPLRAQNGSITIATSETELYIKLEGHTTDYDRTFAGYFQVQACVFAIPLSIHIMHSPVLINKTEVECEFNFVQDKHKPYYLPSITMEEFNYSKSSLEVEGGTFSGQYRHDPPTDFFPVWKGTANKMTLKTTVAENSNEYYRFHITYVDLRCSGLVLVTSTNPTPLISPKYELNNGSYITECRYVIQHSNSKNIFGLVFENLYFNSVNDIIAINDGPSERSSPLLQVTTSNKNKIMTGQMVRSSSNSMWLSFNPVNYSSFFSANITVHGQGGYFKNNGSISMGTTVGNDSVFLLEVEVSKIVLLNFTSSNVKPPGKVDIYDGFDQKNLLASLQGNIWYPVLGKSSQLMIIATGFADSSFTAEFEGVLPGCYQMSTLTSENYILNESCNTTCQWVIPSQNLPNSMLALDIQYLSLKGDTKVEIIKLDPAKTLLGSITSNVTHVPQLVIEANIGALVKVIQGKCDKSDDVILVGHSSYVPTCGGKISPKPSESFFITSPRYPDTYPLLANCQWNISVAKDNFVHMAFNSMQLAPNHCIKIINGQKTFQLSGSKAPDDLLLQGETAIEFNSKDCKKSLEEQKLVSDVGFMLNNSVADCGGVLQNQKTGEFTTSIVGNKSLCIWMISIPAENDKFVNSISFTIVKKDALKNYNLQIYDGASVRQPEIQNMSSSDIWARTNNLIVMYKRLDPSKPSAVFVFNYKTISCNSSMQCENGICLHPDWRCNGIDECGDFTDEKNCASVPVPKTETTGVSSAVFGSVSFILLVVGILVGAIGLHYVRKYRDGYSRFSSSIE